MAQVTFADTFNSYSMEQLAQKTPRIEAIDALRGFAVLAILLLHNVEHFILPVYPTHSPAWLVALDAGVLNLLFSLFSGKAYAIFSLLFGFTFYIQMENQRRKGGDFGYRFLWRLVLLVLFATLNAAFFPAGDILLLYATMGIVLFITRHWSNRAILITLTIFTLQPIEWFHYIMGLVNPDYQLPDYGVAAMYTRVNEITLTGNWLDFLWCNITLGQKASFMWAVEAGRLSQTAGLFLIGFYIGRKGLFASNERNMHFWTRALIICALISVPLYSLKELLMQENALVQQTVTTVFDMWQKLAFTGVWISSFLLLYQSKRVQQKLGFLRSYGRMSLTNYVSQSLIGALIYFPVGLYLAPYCGCAISLLIALVVFAVQVHFSIWWLGHHKQGPLEGLWHKWTWIKRG